MTSAIAPVYNGDFLEGVVGIDVTVESMIHQVLDLKTEGDGYALLIGRDGTILALPEKGEEDWNLHELTDHTYEEAIRENTYKPEDFNIYKKEGLEDFTGQLAAADSGTSYVDLSGSRKAVAWSTIPETGWKLILFEPEESIFATLTQLQSTLNTLVSALLLVLGGLFVLYLIILMANARRMAGKLAEPLDEINGMADKIGSGDYYQEAADYQVAELDATAAHIANMGSQLGETRRNLVEKEPFVITLASIGEGVIVSDPAGLITLVNDAAERITGRSREELVGKVFNDVLTVIDVKTKERVEGYVGEIIRTGKQTEARENFALLGKDGSEIRISASISLIRGKEGSVDGVVLSFRDVSKEYELERQVESFMEVNLDILCILDKDGCIRKINRNFEETLGYPELEVLGKPLAEFAHPDDRQATAAYVAGLFADSGETTLVNRCIRKDGTYRFIEWSGLSGAGELAYTSARDVTKTRLLEEELRQTAIVDRLTGLFNRNHFDAIIKSYQNQADRHGEPLSMMILDIDLFKNVNDSWGHSVGDEVLIQIASVLRKNIRSADVLFRFGGEEFVILMPKTGLDEAADAAEKIRGEVQGNPLPSVGVTTVSIGVAEHMKGESFKHWFKRMDGAMYRAKNQGRNQVVLSDGTEKIPLSDLHQVWREQWNSGFAELDRQHRELAALGNELVTKALGGEEKGPLLERVDILLQKIASHFEFEGAMLAEKGYPLSGQRGEEHMELMAKARELRAGFEGGEIQGASFFSYLLDDVIFGHLLDDDLPIFEQLKKPEQFQTNGME